MIDYVVLRKQILCIKTNALLADKDLDALRADIAEQMKTGIVFIAKGVEAFTVDADEVKVVVEGNSDVRFD